MIMALHHNDRERESIHRLAFERNREVMLKLIRAPLMMKAKESIHCCLRRYLLNFDAQLVKRSLFRDPKHSLRMYWRLWTSDFCVGVILERKRTCHWNVIFLEKIRWKRDNRDNWYRHKISISSSILKKLICEVQVQCVIWTILNFQYKRLISLIYSNTLV